MTEVDPWQAALVLQQNSGPPTAEQWNEHRQIITELYFVQKLTMVELEQEMKRRFGFIATRKMYMRRLHKWGLRRYSSEETRNNLCTRLLDDYRNGRDTSYASLAQIKQLLRHHKTKRQNLCSEDLDTLHNLARGAALAGEPRHQRMSNLPMRSLDSDDLDFEDLDTANLNEQCQSTSPEVDSSSDTESDLVETNYVDQGEADAFLFGQGVEPLDTTSGPLSRTGTASQDLRVTPQSLLPSIVNQYAIVGGREGQIFSPMIHRPLKDTGIAVEGLLHLTRAYYTPRLRQHLQLQVGQAGGSDSTASRLQVSKDFWKSVKNALYLFNKGNFRLPYPILQRVGGQIPDLCTAQPISLLRELLTTLALSNTRTCLGVRLVLLRPFARSMNDSDQAQNLLRKICLCLEEDWIRDEVLTAVLCSMLRIANEELLPDDEELFELNRAHIRLLRRRNRLDDASLLAAEVRPQLEFSFGHDSVQTRLVMSEQLYISNAHLKWQESLNMATDIVDRARRYDGTGFPSQRSIYHLEDLAEVYERLNNPLEAAHCLRSALDAAMNMWHDREGTLHIKEKLHRIQQS